MSENPYKPPESDILDLDVNASGAFTSLFDLGYERSGKQAVAFYFVYLIILLCAGFLSGQITTGVFGGSIDVAFIVGVVLAVLVCTALSVFVCVKKSILKSYRSIGLIFLTLVTSAIMGALIGLITVSYLTTRGKKHSEFKNESVTSGSDAQTSTRSS
ncbi:hypothetical protein GCM10008090_27680 [Arenicella chitinivorans]|uniref:Uncharacterized protein n=1 Tax=Arenicella chitinivorans TaxID=1329800 RepID=A0A918VRH1_9GAMM|nr:hypothetical protein [Arenicella chitinivorans]GHA16337.1 hypothetical protein GCM10008090_27680 [Arenicella chitinivorans]